MSFWDKVMGSTPSTPQQQFSQPAVSTPWFVPAGTPTAPVHVVPIAEDYHTTKNTASNRSADCPECGSGNLFRPSSGAMEHCYDCGWNPRFNLVGVGASYGKDSKSTRQASTTNNFNPHMIVGRVEG